MKNLGAGFVLISIPEADRRNKARFTGFDEYLRETNSLWPFGNPSSRNLDV